MANRMGHYFLSVVDFEKDASGNARAPAASESYFRRGFTNSRPNVSSGGMCPPYAEPPRTVSAREVHRDVQFSRLWGTRRRLS